MKILNYIPEATSEVISAAGSTKNEGEVVILVRGPHGKSARREELLHAKGEDDAAISLFYNRKTNKGKLFKIFIGIRLRIRCSVKITSFHSSME